MLEFEMREVKKKFKAIGYIRHVNLVRVVSFSSDQFDRLLVNGHMPNGYLDKWIFPKINAFITCLEAKKENHH